MLRFLRLPTRIPVGLPDRQTSQKWLAALVIASAATLIATAWRHTAVISTPMGLLDDLLYDSLYHVRKAEDRTNGPVVIVAISQADLDRLNSPTQPRKYPWPWPRTFYGMMLTYLQECGARVAVFDMLFSETSVHQYHEDDDAVFAEALKGLKMPVVFGTVVSSTGQPGHFEPAVPNPILGGVNEPPTSVLRTYEPLINGFPSLAYRGVAAFKGAPPTRKSQFLTHYYGPYKSSDGRTTYRYVGAADVIYAALGKGAEVGLSRETFRDKIVVIGGIAANLQDDKAVPLSAKYPGVEWQATAIENMLFNQRVKVVSTTWSVVITLAASFLAAGSTLIPRSVPLKLVGAGVVILVVVLIAGLLFRGHQIRYLPLAAPLVALLLATLAAFAWSYFTEGRQRAFFTNVVAMATSPEVAQEISRDPDRIKLGGQRRDVTIMFTDLAGFTDFSEKMDVEKLTYVIQTYMEAMSEVIVRQGGYLDKYIGDAIMSSWNGLTDQADCAANACRAALGIKRREVEIAEQLRDIAGAPIITRIGVHTGRVAFGNLGCSRKLQITVLGDSVNLAARLEPANKLYDTEVIISQVVADQVQDEFVMRELDLLAVKGKTIPMAVYELIAEGAPSSDLQAKLDLYAAGLAHYRAQRWDDAEATWTRLLKDFPNDGPATKMMARIAKLRHDGLPPDWDGVYRSKEK
jgi:adenylate cyclase